MMNTMNQNNAAMNNSAANQYAAARRQYGKFAGTFRMTRAKDMGVSTIVDKKGVSHQVHKFFWDGMPIASRQEEPNMPQTWTAINQTVFMDNPQGAQMAANMVNLINYLHQPNVKSILTQVVYKPTQKIDANGQAVIYRDADGVYPVKKEKAALAKTPFAWVTVPSGASAAAQPQVPGYNQAPAQPQAPVAGNGTLDPSQLPF